MLAFPSALALMESLIESALGSIDSSAFHSLFFWLSADLENPLVDRANVSFPSLKFPMPKPNEPSELEAEAEDGEGEGDEERGGVCFRFRGC